MKHKAIIAVISALLCISLATPAHASSNPYAALEAKSRQAVETAIRAGTVPAGTTIYDCAYSTGADGTTIVVQYRDKNGNWVSIGAQPSALPAAPANPSPPAEPQRQLTADELGAYADEVFEIVNREREKAGLLPLAHDSLLDEAAMIRTAEVKIVDDAGGKPHTRPDGTGFRTVLEGMGINGNRCAENLNRSKATPQAAMESWMNSQGHREIILKERYGTIGIGVYQRPDGKFDWIQIFQRK